MHDMFELTGDKKFLNVPVPSGKAHCTIDHVAIFGSADVDERHPLYQEVFSMAKFLARKGYVVVNGGGPGTMEAATKGAQAEGGKVVGVTFDPANMPEYEGRDLDNIVDLELKAKTYIERMFGLIEQADIFICVQGGTGTLSEWATSWLLAHLQFGNHKPLILYGAFWHEVMAVIENHFFVSGNEKQVYKIVDTFEELVAAMDAFEYELGSRCDLPPRPDSE